jgi:hypothetical protein
MHFLFRAVGKNTGVFVPVRLVIWKSLIERGWEIAVYCDERSVKQGLQHFLSITSATIIPYTHYNI